MNKKTTILAESGEGDSHDLRSLRTKVEGRSAADPSDHHRALHQTVRTPTVENCLANNQLPASLPETFWNLPELR